MNRERVVGKILELFVSKKGDSSRTSKEKLTVDENGVWEDKFYGKEPNRSLLITSLDSYNLAKGKNISVAHGTLGENILMDYNPYMLNVGTQIRVGEVILEISQSCTLCKSLTKIDNRLPKLLKNDRGVFARVIKSGHIHKSDEVSILYFKYDSKEL
ncbi:MOSC domain-containing protein [Sulfurovum sp. bin170]|nr:MOSC domain-containing protein [Sulfurovum sp. bin170]